MTRALLLVVLCSLLMGPAPGAVGGCNEELEQVEAEDLCRAQQALVCEREYQRGERGLGPRTSLAARDLCREQAATRCASAALPEPCVVTTRARDRCLGALSEVDRLDEASDDIAECKLRALCGPDFEENREP